MQVVIALVFAVPILVFIVAQFLVARGRLSIAFAFAALLFLWPAVALAYDGPTPPKPPFPNYGASTEICQPDPESPTTCVVWISKPKSAKNQAWGLGQCIPGTIESAPEKFINMSTLVPGRQWRVGLATSAVGVGCQASLFITDKATFTGAGVVLNAGSWLPASTASALGVDVSAGPPIVVASDALLSSLFGLVEEGEKGEIRGTALSLTNDASLGARVVLRTDVEGRTRLSGTAIYKQNSYIPAVRVFVAFGDLDFDDPGIGFGFTSSDGVAWNRPATGNLLLPIEGNLTRINAYAIGADDRNIVGLSLACTQETPRRLVCRGGPQP